MAIVIIITLLLVGSLTTLVLINAFAATWKRGYDSGYDKGYEDGLADVDG